MTHGPEESLLRQRQWVRWYSRVAGGTMKATVQFRKGWSVESVALKKGEMTRGTACER